MKTISSEKYLEMQIAAFRNEFKTPHYINAEIFAKEYVDKVLKLNSVTVADSPQVKPVSEKDFYEICDRDHEVGDGIEMIVRSLRKLGLITSEEG